MEVVIRMKFTNLIIIFVLFFIISCNSNTITGNVIFDQEEVQINQPVIVHVNGDSMSGLLENNYNYTFDFNYTKNIEKGDIVLYDYKGLKGGVVKQVKARQGDHFELKKQKDTKSYYLYVNDELVTNSFGESIRINSQGQRMLHLYEKDYHNTIPPNTFLLLGNKPYNTIDSTKFGLISREDILGVYAK